MFKKFAMAAMCLAASQVGFGAVEVQDQDKDFVWYCESDEATEAQKDTVSEIYYTFSIDQKKVGCKEALKQINDGYDTYLNFIDVIPLTDLSPIAGLKNIQILECNVCSQSAFDTIPPMPSLTNFNFSGSEISSFSKIERFPNIKYLNLNLTLISNLSEIEKATAIEYLSIASTKINNLSTLKSLPKLTILDISNLETSALDTLPILENLSSLFIAEMGLTHVPNARTTPNVKELFLDNNKLESVEGIKSYKSLRVLGLSGNMISHLEADDLPTELTALFLYTPSYENYSFLEGLINLKDLEIGYSKTIKWKELEHLLPQLETLYLFYSKIGPKNIPEGKKESWKNMKTLVLGGTNIDSLAFLKQVEAPKLKIFGAPDIEEKNEENCPTSGVPEVVAEFCKR